MTFHLPLIQRSIAYQLDYITTIIDHFEQKQMMMNHHTEMILSYDIIVSHLGKHDDLSSWKYHNIYTSHHLHQTVLKLKYKSIHKCISTRAGGEVCNVELMV